MCLPRPSDRARFRSLLPLNDGPELALYFVPLSSMPYRLFVAFWAYRKYTGSVIATIRCVRDPHTTILVPMNPELIAFQPAALSISVLLYGALSS